MRAIKDYFPATIVVCPSPDQLPIPQDYTSLTTSPSTPQGARHMDRVRVVIMQDDESYLIMIAADSNSGPRLIFSERLKDYNPSPDKTQDSQAITLTGKTIAFRYVQGCNCGSRLRSWSPYRNTDSVKDPLQ